MRILRHLLVLAAIVGAGAGLTVPASGTPGRVVAPVHAAAGAPAEVAVVREHGIRLASRRLVAGPIRLVVRNRGRRTHHLELLRTDRPLHALRTRGGRLREPGGVARVTVRPRRAGQTESVTLAPGRYVLICRLAAHVRRGVATTLQVVAPAAPSDAPIASPGSQTPTASPPPAATPAPAPTAPPAILDGRALFRANCGSCHTLDAAGTTGTVGPNLGVTRPTADQVVLMVESGFEPMTFLRDLLMPEQVAAIAEFVGQAVGG